MRLQVTAESHFITLRAYMDADAWWRENNIIDSNLEFEKKGRKFRLEVEGPPETRLGQVYEGNLVVWKFRVPAPNEKMMSDSYDLAD